MCESLHEVLSTSRFGTTTDIEDGFLCLCDQLCSTLDLNLVNLKVRLEAGNLDVLDFIWIVFHDGAEDINRDINENWPRTSGARDMKRFVHHTWEVIDIFHKPVVLGNRHRNSGDVCFLECIFADDFRADLSGDGDHRD